MIPRLPRAAWTVLAGDAMSAVGAGMTLPFLIVYLHSVRGLSLVLAGLAASALAVASLAGNLISGILCDRVGWRGTMIGGLLASAAGAVLLIGVRHPWQAFVATGTIGLGTSTVLPAQDALLAALAGRARGSSVFSLRHATLNVGLGVGALVAAALVSTRQPHTFTILYVCDAATSILHIGIVAVLPPVRLALERDGRRRKGYRGVIADRALLRVCALLAFVVTISFGQFSSAFPAFATQPGHIPAGALSLAYGANSITVVVAQLFVLRFLRTRLRTTAITLACCGWGAAWLITLAAGHLGAGAAAAGGFVAALVVFGLAETFLSPTFQAIVNDIAPDELRGRYNGFATLSWTMGWVIGPAIAGLALGAHVQEPFFLTLVGACAIAAVAARRLAAHLPSRSNLIEAS